jgi:hypothetical protein
MDVFIQVDRHISSPLLDMLFLFVQCTERCVRVDSVTASQLGGPEFKPRSGDRLLRLRFLVVYSVALVKFLVNISN